MTAKSNEQKLYMQNKIKIQTTKINIWFLTQCLKNKVFPTFIHLNAGKKTNLGIVQKVLHKGKLLWLKMERCHMFSKLQQLESDNYKRHLKITKNSNNLEAEIWRLTDAKINAIAQNKAEKKFNILKKKLSGLKSKQLGINREPNPEVQLVEGYIKNLSSTTLSKQEEKLLNKGLTYSLPPMNTPTDEIVSYLEVAAKALHGEDKQKVRLASKDIFNGFVKNSTLSMVAKREHQIAKTLREKEVYYIKADKGNSIVILDKVDYQERVQNLLDEGPYRLKNTSPLTRLTKLARDLRTKIAEEFGTFLQWKLMVSNPTIPKLYALPKVHKPGNQMRPIVANTNSPFEKISKWLVQQFSNLEKPSGFDIKNQFELVDSLKTQHIEDNEIMVSFDVTALFPNIPISDAIKVLKNWLLKQNIDLDKTNLLCKATTTCMEESYLEFNKKIYKQTFGTSMGNALSPFIANIYMCNLEEKMKSSRIFPRIWRRYVDDIFAVIKKNQLRQLMKFLNEQTQTIKFTYEEEENGKLPFLDLMIKKENKEFQFAIYRKPTTTFRYIPRDSYHPMKHKMAAFNSMVHRLVNIPMSTKDYKEELETIKTIATANGYKPQIIDKLVRSRTKIKQRRELTTLKPSQEDNNRRFKINYVNGLTQKLKAEWRKYNIELIETASLKLGNMLGNTKSKTEKTQKAGIYSIKCSSCDLVYIGQTRRTIEQRFKEHMQCIKNNKTEQSALAKHAADTGHQFTVDFLELIKEVRDNRLLDPLESYYILKHKDKILNADMGPLASCLINVQ